MGSKASADCFKASLTFGACFLEVEGFAICLLSGEPWFWWEKFFFFRLLSPNVFFLPFRALYVPAKASPPGGLFFSLLLRLETPRVEGRGACVLRVEPQRAAVS